MPTNAAPAATGPLSIGLLVYPELDQLDFTGPFEIAVRIPGADVHVLWKSTDPVADQRGLVLKPTLPLASCGQLDVVVVPGGRGQQALMEDAEVLGFLRRQAAGARYVMSVCTGALVLGAAGLLHGYRATTHWLAMPMLPAFGAIPVDERVVLDRDRLTCAGVTSGIDGALTLAGLLRGQVVAEEIQLAIEYDPQPPYRSGSRRTARPERVAAVAAQSARLVADRRALIERMMKGR